jgi:hypothetical protein
MTFHDDLDLSDQKDPRNWDTGNSTISQFLAYLRDSMDHQVYDAFYSTWLNLPKGAALWAIQGLSKPGEDQISTLESMSTKFYTNVNQAEELLSYVTIYRRKEGQVQEDLPVSGGQTQGSTEDPR